MTKRLTILDDSINEIYDRYWNHNERLEDIGRDYGCWGSTIGNALKRNGFSLKSIKGGLRANAKYSLNIYYFDCIDTEEKAYFLGFIASDGHVSKQNVITFSQHKKDIDILEKFKNSIQSDAPIRIKKDYAIFTFRSKRIAKRLNEIGISNDKTFTLSVFRILQSVPAPLQIHFARGFFDGDGGIGVYKYPYFKKHQYYIGVTGLKETCEYFKDLWELNTALCSEGNDFYTCRTGCARDAVRILEMLYGNASVYMDRKYHSYLNMVKTYNAEYAC